MKIIYIILVALSMILVLGGCGPTDDAINHPNCMNRAFIGNCCIDCEELGKEYYKKVDGGFGPHACWCREGNNTVRIW